MKDKILLFIPMYNCEKQIVRVLNQLRDEMSESIDEVVIVNNRSTDNGESAVMSFLQEEPISLPVSLLRNNENYGLGGSHKIAFQYAAKHGFDYVLVLHGDDQGRLSDFRQLIDSGEYTAYDCCLGARFMSGSKLEGYSKIRTWGNYVVNTIFSIVVGYNVKDMGSGLNMFKVERLRDEYYIKFPDTLYFNNCMMLAYKFYHQRIKFVPISWRESDQISNNKLLKFTISVLKMLVKYATDRNYLKKDLRTSVTDNYLYSLIFSTKLEEP